MTRRRTEDRVTRSLVWSCVVVVVACTQHVDPEAHASSPSTTEVPSVWAEAKELPSSTTERSSLADSESRVSLRSAPSLRAAFVRERQKEGASDARYRVVHERGELVARSPARRVTGRFDSDGFHVSSEDGPRGTLRTDALRCDDVRVPAGRAAFAAGDATNRVERAIGRGELVATEWIESGPLGLEQGFDVSASRCAELVVELVVEGLRPERSGDGAIEDRVRLVGDEGALAYGELFAIDADGRSLPARFAVNGQSLELVVDTRDATWPVVVDPLVYVEDQIVTPPEGLGSDGAEGDEFGFSVAIDGDLAIVGAPGDDIAGVHDVGSAYVFARSGDAWVIEAKLVVEEAEGRRFGSSAALSGDTALIGTFGARGGSAYVFARSGTTWTQQAELVADDGGRLGAAVALVGDTALVGADVDVRGAAYVFVRTGTTWAQQAKLVADDGEANDRFGFSVALSAETALVSAYGDDSLRGSAYVFVRTGTSWTQQAKLVASDRAMDDYFGWSVAVHGDDAVVGAPGDDGGGAAYAFVRSGTAWTQQARLAAEDAEPGGRFGSSVALSGNTLLVGDPADASAGSFSGSTYAFVWRGTAWEQREKLVAIDAEAGDRFGSSVALSEDTAIVGAYRNDSVGGAAFVLVGIDTWAQTKLVAGNGAGNDWFGLSVALSHDTAVVGAPGEDGAGGESGSAYVFARSATAWVQQTELVTSDGAENDRFGFSVALSNDTALVGAFGDDDAGSESGAAYVFVRSGTTWVQQAKLVAADGARDEWFGVSVAISGDTALVGAARDESSRGSAYVFVRRGMTWSQQAKLEPADGTEDDYFGWSVALSEDSALVGAYGADLGGMNDAGSAYVFVRSGSTWSQQAKLIAADGAADDMLGSSVALLGDTALLGATGDEHGGSAHVFVRHGIAWSQQAKLVATDGGGHFGSSVALATDAALVGAPHEHVEGISRGAVYAYTRSGSAWEQRVKFVASRGSAHDYFGSSVALSGAATLIGAWNQVSPPPYGNRSGAVYFGSLSAARGDSCSASDMCDSGFCVDGVCCDTACGDGATDDCQACAIAAGAAVDGVCGATTGNACDDGLACTTLDVCDAGVCDGASACDDATSCTEASGVFVCGVCPAGSFSVDGTGATECVPCATGTWSVAGATTCVPWTVCGVGSRVVSVASPSSDRECAPCEAGTFSSTMNASVCVAWSDCPAGTFVREVGSATSDRTCDACVSGFSSTTNAGSCDAWTECGVGEFSSGAPTSTRDRECTTCSRCDEGEVEISRCAEAADTVCARVDDAGIPIFDGGLDDGGLADGSVDARPTEGGVSGGGGCGCHTSAPGGSAFGVLLGVGWMLFARRRR